jgi:hypothetical protein
MIDLRDRAGDENCFSSSANAPILAGLTSENADRSSAFVGDIRGNHQK